MDQGTGLKVGTPGSRDPEHSHRRLLSLLQQEEWFSKCGLVPRLAVSASFGALLELIRNANSQAHPRTRESNVLELEPRYLCLNTSGSDAQGSWRSPELGDTLYFWEYPCHVHKGSRFSDGNAPPQ